MSDALENLTDEEKVLLRESLPTLEEVMIGWALPVIAAPPGQQRLMVAAQVEVLTGLWEDPEAWCVEAIKRGREFNAQR